MPDRTSHVEQDHEGQHPGAVARKAIAPKYFFTVLNVAVMIQIVTGRLPDILKELPMWHLVSLYLSSRLRDVRRRFSAETGCLAPDFETYSLQRMRPLTTGVLLLGLLEYLLFVFTRTRLPYTGFSISICSAVFGGLVLLTWMMLRIRTSFHYGIVGAAYAVLIEIGFLTASQGVPDMLGWVLPALMIVPVSAAALWLTRKQFVFGSIACALAIYAFLWHVALTPREVLMSSQYFVMNVSLSTILHATFYSLRQQAFDLATSLAVQASLDGLTGLLNRRAFLNQANALIEKADTSSRCCIALYMDLDHFKRINDGFGHSAGDKALQRVAACLAEHVRPPDLVGRLGGEEFAVLMLADSQAIGSALAARLSNAVAAIDGCASRLSISIGVASWCGDERIESLLHRADAAMMMAKSNGRNRVVEALTAS